MGAGASEHEYDVFLSYNSKSVEEVAALAVRLRSEHELRVFFDRWELVPGDPVIPALERAIDRSETVAVFVGPDGIGPWQELERQAALHHAIHTGRRVIPALLRGASPDGVPGFLRTRGWVELESTEGFARLVAGIVGKTPGEVLGHGSATAGGRAVAAAATPPPEQIEPARPTIAATGSGTMPARRTAGSRDADRAAPKSITPLTARKGIPSAHAASPMVDASMSKPQTSRCSFSRLAQMYTSRTRWFPVPIGATFRAHGRGSGKRFWCSNSTPARCSRPFRLRSRLATSRIHF